MEIKPTRRWPYIGSGSVIVSATFIALCLLLYLGHLTGWNPTWRTVGVTPLEPHFFDMHAVTDHAECASKGFNAYILNACDPRTPFNYPPVWLWLGGLGIGGADSNWLSILMTGAAFAVMVALLKGRPISDGAVSTMAILSPSVLMGVERGNVDLFIFALVGGAAIILNEQKTSRTLLAGGLIGLAVVLKLYPLFCIALVARLNWRTLAFAAALILVSLVYFGTISDYILIIRQNTPTSFMLSYGFKVPFLGLDHLRAEAGLSPLGLADTWLPTSLTIVTVIFAITTALIGFRRGSSDCTVADGVVGTAFLFGAGIYCGTFMLGTNFIYRLMFLLLCLPQLQDWAITNFANDNRTVTIARVLLVAILLASWLGGNSNGHSTFIFVPQLANWLIFFGLITILLLNFLQRAVGFIKRQQRTCPELVTRGGGSV
ncbi:MAG TPA: glycosyltransferase family 87 protein [Pirellulales bacterium]